MVMQLYYPITNNSKINSSFEYNVQGISMASTPAVKIRDLKTTKIAMKLLDHIEIVAESRRLINEGKNITWNEYSNSK